MPPISDPEESEQFRKYYHSMVNGFHIEKIALNGFCPYLPPFYKEKPLAHYVDRLVGKVPLVSLFGAGYVVTAVKT